jgi:serine/threonine protein kinase
LRPAARGRARPRAWRTREAGAEPLPRPRAGHLPFEGREKADIKRAITLHRMRPLPPSISPACADFVRAMLTHDAALRPSAAALLGHPYLLAHAPLEQRLSAPAALPPGRLSGERSGRTPLAPCFPCPALHAVAPEPQ